MHVALSLKKYSKHKVATEDPLERNTKKFVSEMKIIMEESLTSFEDISDLMKIKSKKLFVLNRSVLGISIAVTDRRTILKYQQMSRNTFIHVVRNFCAAENIGEKSSKIGQRYIVYKGRLKQFWLSRDIRSHWLY